MPKLDFANKDRDRVPCRVFDAAGVEHERVVRCDTESGHVEKYRPDPNDPDRLLVNCGGIVIVTDIIHAPAPLTIGEW